MPLQALWVGVLFHDPFGVCPILTGRDRGKGPIGKIPEKLGKSQKGPKKGQAQIRKLRLNPPVYRPLIDIAFLCFSSAFARICAR